MNLKVKPYLFDSKKNWQEDYECGENCYESICSVCGCSFLGHKHRFICKECITSQEQPNERRTTSQYS